MSTRVVQQPRTLPSHRMTMLLQGQKHALFSAMLRDLALFKIDLVMGECESRTTLNLSNPNLWDNSLASSS